MGNNPKAKVLWICLGALSLLLRYLVSGHSDWVERYYSRGLFVHIRSLLDLLFAWLPFPLLLPLSALLLFWLLRRLWRFGRRSMPWPQRLLRASFSLLSFLGATLFWFLFLWGFNYGRIPIETQLALQPHALDSAQIRQALFTETDLLLRARPTIPGADSTALNRKQLPPDLEAHIRPLVEAQLREMGYPAASRLRARRLLPRGILLRISTAGFYLPFTGECNLDAGLHPIQIPFVMAHEFAHGYGITDEGACNFIAYLACCRAPDGFIRYSGHYGYWRYLRSAFYRLAPDAFEAYLADLDPVLRTDARAVRKNSEAYPDLFPKFRNLTYDTYLKAQGVREGLRSYNRVVLLVDAWRKTRESETTLDTH